MWELSAALGARDGEPAARKDKDTRVRLSDANTSRHASARLHQNVFPTRWGRGSGDYRADRGPGKEKPQRGWKPAMARRPWSSGAGGTRPAPSGPRLQAGHPARATAHHQLTPHPGLGGSSPLGRAARTRVPPSTNVTAQERPEMRFLGPNAWEPGAARPHVQREDVCRPREASLAPDSTFI